MDVDGYTLWINGGSLLFVAPQVKDAERQAVLDSHLYAQLLANKRAGSRFTQHDTWYRTYRTALTDRGWLLTQQYQAVETVSALAPVAPVQPLQTQLVSQCPAFHEVLANAVEALRQAPDLQVLDVLRQQVVQPLEASTVTHIALEVGVVQPGPVVLFNSVVLGTEQVPGEHWLVEPLAARSLIGETRLQGFSAQLESSLYEPYRQKLASLMAEKRQAFPYTSKVASIHGAVTHG
uniref:hypothetical protein n=1 Tax=Pseudomonas laurentiana TaxID=2364649 RepID=UPI0029C7153D|nr:hypothetical protein [Pseudomonas laurentiana]